MSLKRWFHLGLCGMMLFGAGTTGPLMAWGTMAHGIFTSYAIDRLPGPLGDFFRANRDFLTCYSVLPDDWWGSPALIPQMPAGLDMPAGQPGPDEVDRHFFTIDEDCYVEGRGTRNSMVQPPIDRAQALEICKKYVAAHGQQALQKFLQQSPHYSGGLEGLPEAIMERAGSVVWVIQERLQDVAAAMKAGNWQRALFLSTIMGHYIGDCHVPLHTAYDYNGQYHPNKLVKGIHSRWEARMLERNEADVRAYLTEQLHSSRPEPLKLEDVPDYVFKAASESFSYVDGLLSTDDQLTSGKGPQSTNGAGSAAAPPAARKAGPQVDNSVYTDAYFAKLYAQLGPVAKERLWKSAEDVALFWQLAWEMAGKPTPPTGKIETPELKVIDYKHNKILPYDPTTGPREIP